MTEDASKPGDYSKAFKSLLEAWADTLKWMQNRTLGIPTIGPTAGLLRNSVTINAELANAAQELADFNKMLAQYYAKVGVAWMEATRKITTKSPIDITDESELEKLRKLWIETFEEEFTTLFDSDEFAEIFGKLLKHEVQFNKHIRKLVEIYSKNLEIPTHSEIESIYEEIERIKKKLKLISDAIEELSGGAKKDIAKVL